MAVQSQHRSKAAQELPQDINYLHNRLAELSIGFNLIADSYLGPKTNSAEKINMLRQGRSKHG